MKTTSAITPSQRARNTVAFDQVSTIGVIRPPEGWRSRRLESAYTSQAWAFVMTLCHCRHQYVEFVWDQSYLIRHQ